METKETMVCKCCGRELPINNFRVTHLGRRKTCDECIKKKSQETKEKKKDIANAIQKAQGARILRLQDFTPLELMQELKRRGYEGKLTYTVIKVIDFEKLDDETNKS